MAKYTIELRNVCEYYGREEVESWFKDYDLSHYLTQEQINIIEQANVWSKDRLATKIVDHYFMREIGLETPTLFKHYAKIKMKEIMEAELPRIYSNFLKYDPLVNVDFTETFTRKIDGTGELSGTNTGTSTSNSNSKSDSFNVNSDTPQTNINKQKILDGSYASSTSANENNSNINDTTNNNSSSKSNSSNQTLEKYSRVQKGNSGSITTAQKLIQDFRNIIVAIDCDIIKQLNILFMRSLLKFFKKGVIL